MGKRGPTPTPNAIKMLEGTYREHVHGGGVRAPDGLPAKPDWLSEAASAVWDERIAELRDVPGLLSSVDGPALAAYCFAWARLHEAQALLDANGSLVCVGEKGGEYQHPAIGIQSKALEMIAKIGAKFGMTPSDRANLKPSVRTVDDEVADLIA